MSSREKLSHTTADTCIDPSTGGGKDGVPPKSVNGSANPSGLAHPNRSAESPNPQEPQLDISRFRIDQNYSAQVATRKKAVVVPVGKPDKQTWICFHPSRDWRLAVMVLDDKINRRVHVVEPELAPEVMGDLVPKLLVAYVTRAGDPGLWAIRLPGETGQIDTYSESALVVVNEYAGQWVRLLTSEATKAYSVLTSEVEPPPTPRWPEQGFDWMFRTAFRGRIISSLEHPLLQQLRGKTL